MQVSKTPHEGHVRDITFHFKSGSIEFYGWKTHEGVECYDLARCDWYTPKKARRKGGIVSGEENESR